MTFLRGLDHHWAMTAGTTQSGRALEALTRLANDELCRIGNDGIIGWLTLHGVHALVDLSDRPAAVQAQCDEARQKIYAQNHWQIGVFQDVVDGLGSIPLCPIKGILLLDSIYADDLSRRTIVDIDLLIPPGDINTAVERLKPLGWEMMEADSGDYHVRLAGHKSVLELHRQLDFRHSPESRWNQLSLIAGVTHDRDVWLLPPEVHFAYLVAHFVKHTPVYRLKWVVDVLLLAGRQKAEELVEAARRLGAFRSVLAGLDFLERLLDRPLVPGFEEHATRRERAAVALNRRLVWGTILERPFAPMKYQSSGRALSSVLLADHPIHGIRFLRRELRERLRQSRLAED